MPFKNHEEQKKYQSEWLRKRRDDWISDNGPCRKCQSSTELQVDHINRANKVNHNVWSWAKKRRLKELAKCQVICLECHKKKNKAEREPPHGTNGRYTSRSYRCRCELCREAHAKTNAAYR